MLTEPMTIEVFVKQAFEVPEISLIIEDWIVDFDQLRTIVSSSLREMGIFQVRPAQASVVINAIVQQLRWSPEVRKLILRAEAIERQRLRTRHSEL